MAPVFYDNCYPGQGAKKEEIYTYISHPQAAFKTRGTEQACSLKSQNNKGFISLNRENSKGKERKN